MNTKYDRLGRRYGRLAMFFVFFLLGLVAVAIFGSRKPAASRINVLLIDNPVVVWSWDRASDTFSAISIPVDVIIPAVSGYGTYSVQSLWRLGQIEKQGGAILQSSLEEILAVPVPLFAGVDIPDAAGDTRAIVKKMFTGRGLWRFIRAGFETNVGILDLLSLAKATRFVRWDRVTAVDVSSFVNIKQQADGSWAHTIDTQKSDSMLAPLFEDPRIRTEALRIAVYNTGSTRGLAQNVGRLLSNMGALVVALDSTEGEEKAECRLQGDKKTLESVTAQFIRIHYDCRAFDQSSDARADLSIYIGRAKAR